MQGSRQLAEELEAARNATFDASRHIKELQKSHQHASMQLKRAEAQLLDATRQAQRLESHVGHFAFVGTTNYQQSYLLVMRIQIECYSVPEHPMHTTDHHLSLSRWMNWRVNSRGPRPHSRHCNPMHLTRIRSSNWLTSIDRSWLRMHPIFVFHIQVLIF